MTDATGRVVAALRRLVAYPTIAGRDNRALVAHVAECLDAAGAAVTVLDGARADAHNLHAVVGPAGTPGGLVLAAHSDVVDVEGQPWSSDPFELAERGGRLYGRGAADMKGFLAAALVAMADLDARALRRPVHLALSSDEELGCLGTGSLLDALGEPAAGPGAVLVGEPTRMRVAVAHKGKAALRVTLRGRAAHSSTPAAGVNAVAHAGRLVVALLEVARALEREERDTAFAVPHSTLGVGPISGGVALNVVPDRCELELELRTLPGADVGALVARVRAAAAEVERAMRERAPEAAVEVEQVAGYPPLSARAGDAFAARVAELAGAGRGAALDFGSEAGLYQRRLGAPTVVCGPGSMEQAHRADEWVEPGQLGAAHALLSALAVAPA